MFVFGPIKFTPKIGYFGHFSFLEPSLKSLNMAWFASLEWPILNIFLNPVEVLTFSGFSTQS